MRRNHSHWNFCYQTPNSSPNGDAKLVVKVLFFAKTHFFVGNQKGEPISIGISAIQPLIHPLTGVQSWG